MPRKTQPKPALGGMSLFGEGALRDLSAADMRNATAIINAVLRGDVDCGSQKEIEKEEVFAKDETSEEGAVVEGKVKQMESNDAITDVPTRQISDVEFENLLVRLKLN
ncbi:hypothetical protein K4K54_004125 [Colletotrichum sp. SAR 10_86]|nr:hypothetical protein KHU50_004776 [Colletotrichum sp. SAR 10_65]KAI8182338.1 hypothetical protein K4K51_001036 [Colletotrichum sp. SAR 10_75]KAI8226024.1 hypothetical protein K4K54_004125 [Colletotrichum sp. SAR 10_86]KAJ5005071.1 hypothetical protein K4K48_008281 [Colletotrichum sp. SAR 10_66]